MTPPPAVRVVELACYRVDIPAEHGEYGLSGGRVYTSFPSTVVKVTADDGTCGYGEASTMGSNYLDGSVGASQAGVRELAPAVFACDPLQAGPLVRAMDALLTGHQPAKAAVDIAMWDLRARLHGVPVATLLGGVQQDLVPAFTAVPLGSLESMLAEAHEIAGRGYRSWQIKVGDDPAVDAARVREVVGVIPPGRRYLSLDANRGWNAAQAIRFARLVRDLDAYIEQPCASLAELERVRANTDHPLVIDEGAKTAQDLLDAIGRQLVDGVNIKPVRVGGLTRAARMRDIAEAAGLTMTVDEPMGALLATASNVHLGATVDPDLLLGISFFGSYDADASAPAFRDGAVTLPDGPGLGVVPAADELGEPVFVLADPRP